MRCQGSQPRFLPATTSDVIETMNGSTAIRISALRMIAGFFQSVDTAFLARAFVLGDIVSPGIAVSARLGAS
jgi:hypothetical protein